MARQGAPAAGARRATAGQDHPSPETDAESHHGLARSFGERIIDIRGMDPSLRTLTLIGLVAILGCAVLLALRDLPFATLPVYSFSLGRFATMSVQTLIGCAAVSILAWCYIVVGALHGHLALRALGLVAYTVVTAFAAVLGGYVWGELATALVLAAAWTLAIGLWLLDRLFYADHAPHRHHRHHVKVPVFLFFVAASAAAVVVLLVSFGASVESLPGVRRGPQAAIVGLGLSLTIQFNLVQYFLAPMLFLAGSDFAEVSEVGAGRLAAAVEGAVGRRAAWLPAGLVILIGGFLFLSQPSPDAAPGVHSGPLGATVALGPFPGFELTLTRGHLVACAQALPPLLLIALAGWFALRRRPAVDVPFGALVVAGLTGFAATLLLPGAFIWLGLREPDAVAAAVWTASVPLAVLGVLLMRRGGHAATAGLFITAAAISFISYWGPAFLFGGPRWLVGAQLPGLSSALGFAAAAGVLALALTRRLSVRHTPLLGLVLTLLLGLLVLEVLHDIVFGALVGSADRFSITQAVLLLAALFWDVAMSGESITNRHGRHVPRHTRVLIFMGYSMLVASWILFFSSFRGEEAGAAGMLFGSSEELPSLGIELLGLPLLLTFFLVNTGAWMGGRRGSEREVVDRSPVAD